MESEKKSAIAALRRKGLGYKRIASELGISRDSVASFCFRNGLSAKGGGLGICPACGRSFPLDPRHPGKRFCSDRCRAAWWNANRESRHPERMGEDICLHCGRPFSHYGGRARKYCSPSCYRASRRKGDGGNGR